MGGCSVGAPGATIALVELRAFGSKFCVTKRVLTVRCSDDCFSARNGLLWLIAGICFCRLFSTFATLSFCSVRLFAGEQDSSGMIRRNRVTVLIDSRAGCFFPI